MPDVRRGVQVSGGIRDTRFYGIQMDTRIMRIHSRKLPVPRRFYNPSDIFSELGLSRGRNLKAKFCTDLIKYMESNESRINILTSD